MFHWYDISSAFVLILALAGIGLALLAGLYTSVFLVSFVFNRKWKK